MSVEASAALRTFALLGLALFASGCATVGGITTVGEAPPRELAAISWVDGRTGAPVPAEDVARRLRAVRVVLVGEAHGTAAHHALQSSVARTLSRGAVAAVEWLPHSARFAVAGWLISSETPAAFFDAIDWRRLWGHAPAAYASFFSDMREAGVPVVPINAEPGLARAVARGTELSPEDAARLPPLDSGSEAHRAWFEAQMAGLGAVHGHGADPARLERMYKAQLVWDETMAGHVRRLAATHPAVVVCAGTGHTTRALGIAARLGGLSFLIVHPAESLDEARARSSDAEFPGREADLFAIVPPAE